MRAVIAEDSVLLRAGVVQLLRAAGMEVVAEVGDAESLLAYLAEQSGHGERSGHSEGSGHGERSDAPGPSVDLVITDVRMPPSHTDEGMRAALTIRQKWPHIAVLLLSQYVEERHAAKLLSGNTRGVGYLLKDRVADVTEFIEVVQRVAAGGAALDPEVVAQLLVRRESDPLERLTPREREVLALMAEGRSNAGIGQALVVGESAVAKHINNIFAKLDLPPADLGHRRVLAVLRFLGVPG
ncbi:response regulator transcription factor [Streptomyces sp. NPDC005900]|uniref:response regulator transcription factor n=1 Tax=Streptomyces sp. NPDC005900 TaxID=3154569 RepID=UPI003403B43F